MNVVVALAEIRAAPTQAEKNLRAASLLCALFRVAGWEMVVVGGSAIEFYTAGDYLTRDLDLCRAAGTKPLSARVEAEVMNAVGARSVGTRRQWLLDALGEVTIDLLGEIETVGTAPLQTLLGPYGEVRLMPVEELLVERVLWRSCANRLTPQHSRRRNNSRPCASRAGCAPTGAASNVWRRAKSMALPQRFAG